MKESVDLIEQIIREGAISDASLFLNSETRIFADIHCFCPISNGIIIVSNLRVSVLLR